MANEVGRLEDSQRPQVDPPPVDAAIGRVAARQRGVISRAQLIGLGLEPRSIGRRLAAGNLHPIHRGVYAVGHPAVSREGRWTAALLAVGPGSVLSHFVAGEVLGLIKDAGTRIDVTTANRSGAARPGIKLHRVRVLHPDDVITYKGFQVTAVARTLQDLAALTSRRTVERAAEEAYNSGRFDPDSVNALLLRSRGRKGAAVLRAILDSHTIGTTLTRSEFEEQFRLYTNRHNLPAPIYNQPMRLHDRSIEADAVWDDARVVLELDSRRYHHSLPIQRRDTTRDIALRIAGYDPLRAIWSQIVNDDPATLAVLRHALRSS